MSGYINNSLLDRWFKDFLNPTEQELQKWMEDPEAIEVEQDWDLCVGTERNLATLARLACGEGPQREYIIHCLYISTGYAFQAAEYGDSDVPKIEDAIRLVPDCANSAVLDWRRKAQRLVSDPTSFRHKDWFNGLYGS